MFTMKKATIRGVVVLAVGASALALGVAAPASANPGDPCPLAVSFLCNFVPIAPDLDEGIDLTQTSGFIAGDPVPQMPTAPDNTDYGPPADICLNGCI